MKVVIKILFAGLIGFFVFTASCKKQPKCGCDGDVINELQGYPMYVYYDSANNSAWFNPVGNPLSTYYMCNPSDFMSVMTRFDNGAYLLVSGSVYWECNYLMRASNNPYYQSYKSYNIDVTDMYEDLYGK